MTMNILAAGLLLVAVFAVLGLVVISGVVVWFARTTLQDHADRLMSRDLSAYHETKDERVHPPPLDLRGPQERVLDAMKKIGLDPKNPDDIETWNAARRRNGAVDMSV